jgi:hypothetical protein
LCRLVTNVRRTAVARVTAKASVQRPMNAIARAAPRASSAPEAPAWSMLVGAVAAGHKRTKVLPIISI